MENFKVVICNNCKQEEYEGYIYWRDGHQYCRKCIYNIWEKDGWKRDYNEPIYPDKKEF